MWRLRIVARYALVAPFVDLFVQVFETSPTIKVVPEIVESLDLLPRSIVGTQEWNRLFFAKSSLTFEYRCESLEERVVVFVFQLGGGRNVVLERLVVRIN